VRKSEKKCEILRKIAKKGEEIAKFEEKLGKNEKKWEKDSV